MSIFICKTCNAWISFVVSFLALFLFQRPDQSDGQYDNRQATINEFFNLQRPDQNANGQVTYDNQQPPMSQYGKPMYDNIGADISPDDHRSRPPPVPTIPPPPEEGYDNEAIEADAPYPDRGHYNPGNDTAVWRDERNVKKWYSGVKH